MAYCFTLFSIAVMNIMAKEIYRRKGLFGFVIPEG